MRRGGFQGGSSWARHRVLSAVPRVGASSAPMNGQARRGGRGCRASRWSAFEIIAMVLGFVVFWPIGLAILGYKFWQRKTGSVLICRPWRATRGRTRAPRWARLPRRVLGRAGLLLPRPVTARLTSGRARSLARLEEERQKLDNAHREFADTSTTFRKAKDREEFERFMNERRNRPA